MANSSTFSSPAIYLLGLFALSAFNFEVFNQTLLIPSPTGYTVGEGACKGLEIAIASEKWRVRKGDVFEVEAVQPFAEKSELKYTWFVSNGKILDG